jgi:hypothetical protein
MEQYGICPHCLALGISTAGATYIYVKNFFNVKGFVLSLKEKGKKK